MGLHIHIYIYMYNPVILANLGVPSSEADHRAPKEKELRELPGVLHSGICFKSFRESSYFGSQWPVILGYFHEI